MSDESLRYPTGKFVAKEAYTAEEIAVNIQAIAALPVRVRDLVQGFTPAKWETPYRPGGWTARQVAHHLPESHMNAYIRTKWALTEKEPVIKVYDEKAWAETPERSIDPLISLDLLAALHVKWVALLEHLSPTQLDRAFFHPESGKLISVKRLTALYAWHGNHHYHHLKIVAETRHG